MPNTPTERAAGRSRCSSSMSRGGRASWKRSSRKELMRVLSDRAGCAYPRRHLDASCRNHSSCGPPSRRHLRSRLQRRRHAADSEHASKHAARTASPPGSSLAASQRHRRRICARRRCETSRVRCHRLRRGTQASGRHRGSPARPHLTTRGRSFRCSAPDTNFRTREHERSTSPVLVVQP